MSNHVRWPWQLKPFSQVPLPTNSDVIRRLEEVAAGLEAVSNVLAQRVADIRAQRGKERDE